MLDPTIGGSILLETSYSALRWSYKQFNLNIFLPLPSVQGVNDEGVPKCLTFDDIQTNTCMEVKGTGTANHCPTIDGGVDSFAFKLGIYNAKKFYLEATSFTVKEEGVSKNSA
ncbi:hypothetical protein EJD97_001522 [Solanum chilense]|uniref:Uncharacterized protein n=1 Tax=Solanum chilense TaxID=4083 RepID=A0A6N2C2T9_SOLCI|nr:hypothetical protein EJD97_001522 [Solanum chilense]